MTERKMYELTDDAVRRLISYARASGSIASHLAADELVPMTERMYTREEMKQAWQNAYAWGWYDACAEAQIKHRLDIGQLNERRAKQHSPYE